MELTNTTAESLVDQLGIARMGLIGELDEIRTEGSSK